MKRIFTGTTWEKEFSYCRAGTHIIRTRMFVTDISQSEKFGKAHGEFFRNCPPVTSMLEVSKLISPEMLIEVEADAVVSAGI